ncbi:MAG: hypothetical protein IJU66_01065 [Oscillospiraceae bacterium]|nr:hypothetical protein [Oscillospiraceae bacterium]
MKKHRRRRTLRKEAPPFGVFASAGTYHCEDVTGALAPLRLRDRRNSLLQFFIASIKIFLKILLPHFRFLRINRQERSETRVSVCFAKKNIMGVSRTRRKSNTFLKRGKTP